MLPAGKSFAVIRGAEDRKAEEVNSISEASNKIQISTKELGLTNHKVYAKRNKSGTFSAFFNYL
jgi:hypothetical protein